VIVTESVFSMDGDIADLRAMRELAERHGACLIVDEAHATAVHGPVGAGLVAAAGLAGEVLAVVHTCGKALASAGGIVCGSKVLRNYLVNHARTLIFSTAMPAYFAGQIRAALKLAKEMDRQREALLRGARLFAGALRSDGWDVSGTDSQIIPVIIGENDAALQAAEFLQRQRFAVRAIRPPTVAVGSARLRLSLTAKITETELMRLRQCLNAMKDSRMIETGDNAMAERA
jgi:8-amino-7-oxononanoate synthase